MFTGLVQGAAKVVALSPREKDGARLTLSHPLLAHAKVGDSISTNGCCLTVVDPHGDQASFDLLAETLRLTNLGDLRTGSVVNFFGQTGADWQLDIKASDAFLRHIVRKGCVAVDGMSLTVADLIPGGFRLWIIPHTLEVTNLAGRQTGDRVNLESDLLAKYAEKLLGKA